MASHLQVSTLRVSPALLAKRISREVRWVGSRHRPIGQSGVTLMELMTVIVIISILAVILIPIVQGMTHRAHRAACTNNLRSLHIAAGAYVQQNNHWPQIDALMITNNPTAYADAWVDTLKPFGLGRKNWICPSVQSALGNPDYDKLTANHRIDYLATPFDNKQQTPYRWTTQPWFIERSDSHGSGNLMIFMDGKVKDMSQVIKL